MAIALHQGLSHQTDSLVNIARNFDGVTVVPAGIARGERVSAMTTLAATIERSIFHQRAISDSRTTLEPCACGLGLAGHGEAYNEEAFHHFLAIERKRSEASGRPFLLILVELEQSFCVTLQIDPQFAARMFYGLAEGLRDTDVIGWYRHNRIAGAVLTDLGDAPEQTVRKQVIRRVEAALGGCVTGGVAPLVQVRVYQLPARFETLSGAPIRQLEMA
jgi:hypothetical protein